MLKNNLFYQRIQLLTKRDINSVPSDLIFNFPPQYAPLFGDKLEEQNVDFNEIAGIIHDILSRKEEYENINLDKWGRFDHDRSNLVRHELDQSPIVDELIVHIIKQLGLNIRNIWPKKKRAAVCLTHDVDSFDGRSYLLLRKIWWQYNAFISRIKGNKNSSQNYLAKIKRWSPTSYDPIFAFDNWMNLEDKYGFRSTFFFLAIRRTLSKEGRRYSYKHPKFSETLKNLYENGWEIGLHGGYHNHLDLGYLKEQKKCLAGVLGKEIIGCRHHYLRVRYPMSWKLYQKAGFKYSSNIGWDNSFNGFRAGTCLPYKPIGGKNFWEIPFQLMDSSEIENPEEYHTLFLDYLKKVKKVGGCLVINFHQEYFDELESPGTNRAYRFILETLAEDKTIWVATLKDVYSHIRLKIGEI